MSPRSPLGLAHDPDRVQRVAREILGGPPYRTGEPGPLRRALSDLLDGIGRVLSEALGAVGGTPAVAWTIALLGLGVLGAVVWRATRGTTLGRRGARVLPTASTRRSAAAWLTEAEALLAAGQVEAALRARYAAVVITLEERGLLVPRPGRTIRELDGELERALPTLAPQVAAAGARVEEVVFGGRAVTREDLEVVAVALEQARHAGRVAIGSDA